MIVLSYLVGRQCFAFMAICSSNKVSAVFARMIAMDASSLVSLICFLTFLLDVMCLDLCVPCTCTRGSVTQVACQLRSISGLTACHLRVNCARTFWKRSFCGRQHVVGQNVDAYLYFASWMWFRCGFAHCLYTGVSCLDFSVAR